MATAWTVATSASRSAKNDSRRRTFGSFWSRRAASGISDRIIPPSTSAGCSRSSASRSASSGGWTLPSATGQLSGVEAAGGTGKALDTIAPRIGSAGSVARWPTTSEGNSDWVRMFQIALHRRVRDPTGRRPERSGSGSTKPWTPC